MARHLLIAAIATALLGAPGAPAADHPLQGEFLHLSSQVRPGKSRIRLGAIGDVPEPRARIGADPRATGAVLEVFGDQVLGADAPPIPLPSANWRALGDPPGSRGFRYVDRSGRFGVRKAALRYGRVTTFSLSGGGPAWPYRTTGVPGDVTVRLSIGDETFCATFEAFRPKRRGAMVAGHNPPPASCRSAED